MSAAVGYDLDLDLSPEVLSVMMRRRSATARLAGREIADVPSAEVSEPEAPRVAPSTRPWL
jgi:hypothetical protein